MKLLSLVFLLSALAFVNADVTTIKFEPENLTSTNATPTSPPNPTDPPTIKPTTEPPLTKPTTASTTTKPTTASTTTKPTTEPPPTIPTTASTTTKPTTEPPPTKPTPPTSTTPAPKPVPKEPEIGKWSLNYTNPDNTTSQFSCVIVQLALQTEVHYNTTSNTTGVAYINLPKNAEVNGTCGSDPSVLTEDMTLIWDSTNNITLNFKRDNGSSKFYLNQVAIALGNLTQLPNANVSSYNLVHQHAEFNTTEDKSYKCDKVQCLMLSGAENKTAIHVSHVQMQAFANTTNGTFHGAEDCQPFETPDVVPIAVGCSLVILVVVVLVAYLIGRRRREGRGYLSMFTEHKREEDYIPMKNLSCFS